MLRRVGIAIALVLGLTGLAVAETEQPATITVEGEVLDLGCYAAREARGPDHQVCAARCLKNGNPAGLIDAAVEVFAEKGFRAARVSDIARSAGVADGTIYLYFKNKEDLLLVIFEEKMELLLGRLGVAKHEVRQRKPELVVGRVEAGAGRSGGVVQVGAHPYGLGALAGKEKGSNSHEEGED